MFYRFNNKYNTMGPLSPFLNSQQSYATGQGYYKGDLEILLLMAKV